MIVYLLIFSLVPFLSSFGASREPADLIVVNANVRTMNANSPSAEAIAVKGNRIILVGKNSKVRVLAGEGTKVIDAQGRLVLPGFNDAHVHFLAIGNIFSSIDLRDARNPGDAAAKIRHYTRFLPKGRWILGGQWDHRKWAPSDLPTRHLIDRLTPDHPVFIYHSDPKTVLVNSLALKLAKITKDTRDISGGEIVRDEAGQPTGILRGRAVDLVKAIVPVAHVSDWPAVAETASNYAASLGVTSVQDMQSDDMAAIYGELERNGRLRTRIYDCVSLAGRHKFSLDALSKAKTGLVRQGCLKGLAEGGAADEDPTLEKNVADADKAGWQVMLHAIGPQAIGSALTAFERSAANNGSRDRRFRMEHAHDARPEDVRRFGRFRVISSVQPHLFFGGAGGNYRGMLDTGAVLAFGSDAPITDFDPILGIYAAVTANGQPAASLSILEAVRAYTLGSAYAEFQEHVKGTLEPGKLADFVIMSDDIFNIDPVKIGKATVLTTVMDGKVVFQANKL